jgi:hypothetical protein
VRREGVTEAAGKLQRAGLIHYSRGKITVWIGRPGGTRLRMLPGGQKEFDRRSETSFLNPLVGAVARSHPIVLRAMPGLGSLKAHYPGVGRLVGRLTPAGSVLQTAAVENFDITSAYSGSVFEFAAP